MKLIVIFAVLTFMPVVGGQLFTGDSSSGFDAIPNCEFMTRMVPIGSPVTVKFTGGETTKCHLLSATCADALATNCEVCATILGNSDPDCAVQVEFKTGLLEATDRTETCMEREIAPYCSDIYLAMDIRKLKVDSLIGASFDILLTAQTPPEDKTNWGLVGGIIGGVIGGITTIVIVIIWIIVACRKPRVGNQRSSPGSTAPLTHLSSPSYQMDESYTYQSSQGNKHTKPPY